MQDYGLMYTVTTIIVLDLKYYQHVYVHVPRGTHKHTRQLYETMGMLFDLIVTITSQQMIDR